MLREFFDKILSFFYALPFGMKAGDELLATSNSSDGEGTGVHRVVGQKSVLNDLLKGEVTQEVEELRYETFRAEEMSNQYEYVGAGVAVKKKGDSTGKRKKFTQFNMDEEYSLKESLSMMEKSKNSEKDDWKRRTVIKMEYENPNVRFRLENYCYKVDVDMTGRKKLTRLYFIDDFFNNDGRPLVNLLKKTMEEIKSVEETGNKKMMESFIERSEVCSSLKELRFKTINASNDVPNGIDYIFTKPRFERIYVDEGGYVVMEFSWREFDGNRLLSERFRSESAEKKFENKEKREGYVHVVDMSAKPEPVEVRDRDLDNLEDWFEEK